MQSVSPGPGGRCPTRISRGCRVCLETTRAGLGERRGSRGSRLSAPTGAGESAILCLPPTDARDPSFSPVFPGFPRLPSASPAPSPARSPDPRARAPAAPTSLSCPSILTVASHEPHRGQFRQFHQVRPDFSHTDFKHGGRLPPGPSAGNGRPPRRLMGDVVRRAAGSESAAGVRTRPRSGGWEPWLGLSPSPARANPNCREPWLGRSPSCAPTLAPREP